MTSIDEMSPRELCAGLMRGDRKSLKLGYSPESAALSAAQWKVLSEDDTRRLLSYARGFADGLADVLEEFGDDGISYERYGSSGPGSDYAEGLFDGQFEYSSRIYPSLRRVSVR